VRSRSFATALGAALVLLPCAAWCDIPTTAEVNAEARAQGNRKPEAVKIGRALFMTVWPAQLLKVRVEGYGRHEIAGLTLSAVKFHQNLDRAGFLNEIEVLVQRTFAVSSVEEVDVWATVPIRFDVRIPVSGDLAQPTTRIVFAVTCRRGELAGLAGRLRSGDGVYWAADFRARLKGAAHDQGQLRQVAPSPPKV
jgi:hypothetical protein